MRSEDDLRAAFAAKAGEAPAADQVLRAVRQAESRPPARRRWLVPAVAVAAAAAVGVPLGVALSQSSDTSKKAGVDARSAPSAAAGSAGTGPSKGAVPPAAGGSAPGSLAVPGRSQGAADWAGVCRPGDVTVTLRREGTAARLSVTAHAACRLAHVPSISWPSGSTTYRTSEDSAPTRGTSGFGRLAAGATATATVLWAGCAEPGGPLAYVDWGGGRVTVPVRGPTPTASCPSSPEPGGSQLRVSPLTGLS